MPASPKITLVTIGSWGDMQPFLALGLGLQAEGFRVKLVTHGSYREVITQRGLAFDPLPMDPQTLLASDLGLAWLESGNNPLPFLHQVRKIGLHYRDEMLTALENATAGADLLIYSTLSVFGYHLGQAFDIPSMAAPLQPMSRTRTWPSILSPASWELGGSYNWLTHVLVDQLLWQATRSIINPWRARSLSLPKLPVLRGPYPQLRHQREPYLYGFSPNVIPKPSDWPTWHHLAGFWFLNRPAEWTPPAEVVDFLADGPPPVYIGFGSMIARKPERLTEIAIEALKRTGQRGILLSGWANLTQADLPDTIYKIESIPHDWLFPQMAALVHHGGAGTTSVGLRAGVPTIICPFFADQPFWAKRVLALGAGPPPIPQTHLSVDRLSQAIRQTVNNPAMRQRAQALGRAIRAEDGIGVAAQVIRWYL